MDHTSKAGAKPYHEGQTHVLERRRAPAGCDSARVVADGKCFRLADRKFVVKGITYGPFAPDAQGLTFASPEQTARDFDRIRELEANVLRVYYTPPRWFLDLAAEHGLKVFVDIPWSKHLCFLDSRKSRLEAHRLVREAVQSLRDHPAVFACSVVNEIPADIVRWSGVRRVEKFIDDLIDDARSVDAACLFTFASFPPTEFLCPHDADFMCFNVYLHEREPFENYLDRLQMLADNKPLVLGEFGMDGIREGEPRKAAFLSWQIESAFRAGLAGTVVFSFTDDWYRGGMQIEDWAFGLTSRDRQPKESFQAVRKCYERAPCFLESRQAVHSGSPKVSVVVATFNGSRTLNACLESLWRLNYADYEIIVVDDGSTDSTPEIARRFPCRYIRQTNLGLSAARNAGIAAATGEIVAFTDDDCRVDEDWLFHLVRDLQRGHFAGIGGHNFLPPDDSCVAAAVMASPGGPAHVMLSDREAEHVPGCNMAFYRAALQEIGGFDPTFRKAGDDVDVCWRLMDCGYKIGFSHAGFVWHYRRSTVKAYLRQQAGYGEAEALLIDEHPARFNAFGGSLWRGRIYSSGLSGLLLSRPAIYHGIFGSGFFQRLYTADPFQPLMLCGSLGYHLFVNLPLLAAAVWWDWAKPLLIASLLLSLGVCVVAAAQAKLPRHKRRFWSRPLIAALFFLQPIVRGWPRVWRRPDLFAQPRVRSTTTLPALSGTPESTLCYWSNSSLDRYQFLNLLTQRLRGDGWVCKTDSGWSAHDLEIMGSMWSRQRLATVCEELEMGKVNLRCRVTSRWTLRARLLMASIAAIACLSPVFAAGWPWIWLMLVLIPATIWILQDAQVEKVQALESVIDNIAADLKLTRVS